MHLYVHVPFCARRCSYCDFAIAVRKEVPSRVYVDAALKEWEALGRWGAAALKSSPIETLYFGGGTPSHLDPAELTRLIDGLLGPRPASRAPRTRETTLETNPDDVTPARAAAWVAAGIDRVSLGVQSFDPGVLAWMHRVHTKEQALEALKTLRSAGIANISLDLIYALPPELSRDWDRDLDAALALEPEHLSLYGLTVEPHTPLQKWVAGRGTRVADDDRYAEEFLRAHERLTSAGYEHYEVSNYARPGRRAIHNSAYWQRRPFLGLGPSAHSSLDGTRWWNVREYAAWLVAVGADGRTAGWTDDDLPSSVAGSERLEVASVRIEDLYLGLRTIEGAPEGLVPSAAAERWVTAGWAHPIVRPSAHPPVRLTIEGWLRLDALVAQIA